MQNISIARRDQNTAQEMWRCRSVSKDREQSHQRGVWFIVAVIYGCVLSQGIINPRRCRDEPRRISQSGRSFIILNDFVSPSLALLISKHACLRTGPQRFLLEDTLHLAEELTEVKKNDLGMVR
jgi:hypothetical protein